MRGHARERRRARAPRRRAGRRASRAARGPPPGRRPRRHRAATARAGSTSRSRRPRRPVSDAWSGSRTPAPSPRDAVGGPGAAVRDRGEARERAVEELARRAPARVRDEADATGIALAGRIVQSGVVLTAGAPPFVGIEQRCERRGVPPDVRLVRRWREKSPASALAARRTANRATGPLRSSVRGPDAMITAARIIDHRW